MDGQATTPGVQAPGLHARLLDLLNAARNSGHHHGVRKGFRLGARYGMALGVGLGVFITLLARWALVSMGVIPA